MYDDSNPDLDAHPSHAAGETRDDCPFCVIDARNAAFIRDLLAGRVRSIRLA
jgi:hypothetical protein